MLAANCVACIKSVKVNPKQSILQSNDLIVKLESLIIVSLYMEVSGKLVAALRPHRFVLRVVEGVEGEVLDLVVILLEEEVIGQVVEHHRVPAVDGVGLTQFLHT